MKRAGNWKLAAGIGLVAVALVAACARDIGRAGRSATGPDGRIVEGARVSGTLTGSLQLTAEDGTPIVHALSPTTFDARVRGGVARVDSVATVASTRVLGVARRSVTFADRDGRQNEIVLNAPSAVDPVSELQHYRDGKLVVDVSYNWQRQPGGWVLKDRDLQLWRDGQVVLHRHQAAEALQIAAAMDVRNLLPIAGASVLGALAPAPLLAQNLRDCWGEWLTYAGALFVLAAATDALAHNLLDPKLYAAVGAAFKAVDAALDNVVYCETVSYEP